MCGQTDHALLRGAESFSTCRQRAARTWFGQLVDHAAHGLKKGADVLLADRAESVDAFMLQARRTA